MASVDDLGPAIAEVNAVWPATFTALYRARYRDMVRLAFLLTGGDPAAEELVQDAFIGIRARWERVEQPAAYVRAAVVNACRSHRRRRDLERRHAPTAAASAAQSPDELRDAIARLPYRQRAAVVLRYYEDLPEADIAAALRCSIPAVKSLLHRATRDLRKVIEP